MTSQLAAAPRLNLLIQMLEEQFSPSVLRPLLGDGVADLPGEYWETALSGPLTDFLERPGKEFRATLVEASYRIAGGVGVCPAELPKLVEIIHAGSLIVDDIQDDSPVRRGAAALHVAYGLPVALNAGNWLYFWAFALVERLGLSSELQLQVYQTLSRTMFACHYGQGLDLTAKIDQLPQAQVEQVVQASTRLKTGALMGFAAALGAIAAQASTSSVDSLAKFGMQLGVGLQMLDDVGGLLNDKRWQKGEEDLMLGRPTWPWAWLAHDLPGSDYARLRSLAQEVREGRAKPETLAPQLRRALQGSGRVRVRRHLQQAFSGLSNSFGNSAELGLIESETQRLEKSYG